jgi:threonine dehydratase
MITRGMVLSHGRRIVWTQLFFQSQSNINRPEASETFREFSKNQIFHTLQYRKVPNPTTMQAHEILECHRQIQSHIHRSPVLQSRLINSLSGMDLYFKCENFQRMGAFKIRGAVHALLNLTEDKRKRGVVTHSSGNFAQALALAAQIAGTRAWIAMPSDAPAAKKKAAKAYGGELVLCDPTIRAREEAAERIVKETGATFVHPSNDYDVILGQGTAGLELLQDVDGLEYIYVPVGGGGLIAGVALAAHFYGKKCRVMGGEPEMADDAYRSLKSGKIESNLNPDTIADGLKTHLGDINFPIIRSLVDGITTVSEAEIVDSMRLIYERMKLVVEPSAAVALAAALKDRNSLQNRKVGILLSGGNTDVSKLPF